MWFQHAKNLTLQIGDTNLDYVRFGAGKKTLIMLPGLNFQKVKGLPDLECLSGTL